LTKRDWLRFDANDPTGYTEGLSIWKHRVIQRMLAKEEREGVDIYALADAKARMQQIVEEEYISSRSIRRRTKAARFRNGSSRDRPSERVVSQGIGLAPEVVADEQHDTSERQDEAQPTKSQQTAGRSQPQGQATSVVPRSWEIRNGEDWGSDYCLPQERRQQHRR
jgi:hypothetical protein